MVIKDEPSRLLKVLGVKFHSRRGGETKVLLSARDQCLLELAAQRFAAEEAQKARTIGQAPKALRVWRAQPLKFDRQLGRVEINAGRLRKKWMRQQVWPRHIYLRHALAID